MISGHWYDAPGQIDVSESFAAATGRTVGDRATLLVNGKPVTVRIAGEVFIPAVPILLTSWQTLGGTAAGLAASSYEIDLKSGTSVAGYTGALQRALGPGVGIGSGGAPSFAAQVDTDLFRWLALLVGALACLGVLNAALMAARERVHDLGVFKAVGMTPPSPARSARPLGRRSAGPPPSCTPNSGPGRRKIHAPRKKRRQKRTLFFRLARIFRQNWVRPARVRLGGLLAGSLC